MGQAADGLTLTHQEVSNFLGVPRRCLFKYVREGFLPAPGPGMTWAREDVLTLHRWFEAQRVGDATVPRPSFTRH